MILPILAVAPLEHARATLLTEVTQAAPGKPFLAAVEVKMDPHWHVYWQNPGDSGIPTTVAWSAPKGWKVEPLAYPTPHRFAPGGVAAYGYEKRVLLLARVTPTGQPGTLAAKAKWLVCNDACFAGGANLQQTINVGKGSPTRSAQKLQAAQSALPKTSSWPAQAWSGSKTVTLRITPPAPLPRGIATFFPLQSGVIDHGMQAVATLSSGPIVFKMNVSPFPESRSRLQGLLVAPKGTKWPGGKSALIIDARLEKGEPR